jgi:hypothetical protein
MFSNLGSKIRLVTLDTSIDLLKRMVLSNGRSFMADTHFAELEGIKEESTLLLRNFYKVISAGRIWWGYHDQLLLLAHQLTFGSSSQISSSKGPNLPILLLIGASLIGISD